MFDNDRFAEKCGCLLTGLMVNEVIDDERWMILGGFRGRSRAAPT